MAGKKDIVEQALKLVMGEGDEAAKTFLMPKIRPTTDNIHDVGAANFDYYDVVGNKMMPIKNVFGGVDLSMPNQRARVDSLKAAISNPEKGYISRIIVDDEGNVIEGQHRLDALRELGASEIPVTMLRDRSRGVDVAALKSAIQQQGGIHPDQTNQIVDMILDGNPEEYEPPQGFEKWWNTGVGEYNKQRGRISKGPGGFLDDAVRLAGKVISGEGDEAAQAGIRAYHGSPHDYPAERLVRFPTGKEEYIVGQPNVLPDLPQGAEVIQDFPLGRMRMDKIGTGEGAQAYGHGLYAAEAEPTARGYRDALTDRASSFRVENVDMPKWILRGIEGNPDRSGAIAKYREDFQNRLLEAQKEAESSHQPWLASGKISSAKDILAGLDALERGTPLPHTSGRMYEVNIAADPNTFLDWDKPLSEQPEAVRQAITEVNRRLPSYIGGIDDSATGSKAVEAAMWAGSAAPSSSNASNVLREAGIPGIKYLDAGSRGAAQQTQSHMNYLKDRLNSTEASLDKMRANRYTPKRAIVQYEKSAADDRAQIAKLQSEIDNPTRNYVVFDDKLISIIRKYGIAGASAMVGYDLMENLDPKQALAATMADRDYKVNSAISETDEVDDALRVAKDVGGSTSLPVMMEDAKGNKYDAQGNIIPPTAPGPNPQRTPTPQQVGQRAAQDPATFDAMMERYAVPDRDIADYEATRAAVQQQPQQIQQMTHVGAKPRREMTINMPMFGGEYSMGTAPYDVASGLQGMAQGAYDFKTAPAYFFPPTAPIAFGADLLESRLADDPVGLALNLALTPQGASVAKSTGRTFLDVLRQNPKTIGATAGAGAATMASDEAEAGPARWFSKAVEAARAIPMNKMTGEQALAMLRKGTSPEELRWMGAEDFLSGQKSVSKDDLVAFLEKNRVQLNQINLGGSNKPTRLENIDIIDIPSEIRDRHPEVYSLSNRVEELRNELVKLRSMPDQSGLDYYDNFRAVSQEFSKTQADLMRAKDAIRKEYVESIGGLGRPTKYGPDSSHGETLTTPGGKNYSENLYALPQKDIYTPFVDQMRKDVWAENYREAIEGGFTEERARAFADKFNNLKPHELAKFLNKEDELESVFQAQKSYEPQYKGGHWSDVSPDVLFHTRTSELTYEPPGANRPYRVHSIEESQSDPGQAGRKRGFKDQKAMAEVARLRQQTQDLKAKLKSEQARLYDEHQKRIAPYVDERVRYERELRDKYKKGEISLGDMNRLAEAYGSPEPELTGKYRADTYQILNPILDQIASNEAEISRIGSKIGEIPMMPFISNTDAWTDRAIKHELDKAFDNGSDYFSWTPGEVHSDRYDLSRHIGRIDYNPDDGSLIAYNPEGRMVVNESVNDPSELDEYIGEELAQKLRAESDNRRSAIDEYEIDKDDETGEWSVSLYGEPSYDYNGEPLLFRSKGEARDYLNEMMANEFAEQPVTLSGLDIKTGGEGMIGYYDKIFLKRVQEVIRKATGEKPVIETIEVRTADGPRKQLGIRLTDEMREKARFSDFKKGGRVTGGTSYDSNPTVDTAIALTREY